MVDGCSGGDSVTEDGVKYNNFAIDTLVEFTGKITKVGNEPFTNLALMLDDSTMILLDCKENIKSELEIHQGSFYKIIGNLIDDDKMVQKIIVKNVEKVRK
jgi:hypothetical protein